MIRLMTIVALLCLTGCNESEKPKPAKIIAFNPRDPVATAEWLVDASKSIRAAAREAGIEQANNPLRKDKYNVYLAEKERWDKVVMSLDGREVEWPAHVEEITEKHILVKAYLPSRSVDGHDLRVQFETYPMGKEGYRMDGKIPIGGGITLDRARMLNRGDLIRIRGYIDRFADPLSQNYSDRNPIWFSVRETRIVAE